MSKAQFPDISIIVTNYNYGKFLARCLRSCLKQKYVNVEVILVDDCSTDDSFDEIRPFLNDITYLSTQENSGVAAASNLGIKHAKGRFVVRVDADDFVSDEMCFFLSRYLQMNRDAFCVSCDYFLVDEHENKLERKYAKIENVSCGVMYRRKLLIDAGCYDETMRHCEEEELRSRLGDFYTIHHLEMPLYRYRMHSSNKTKTDEYQEVICEFKKPCS